MTTIIQDKYEELKVGVRNATKLGQISTPDAQDGLKMDAIRDGPLMKQTGNVREGERAFFDHLRNQEILG